MFSTGTLESTSAGEGLDAYLENALFLETFFPNTEKGRILHPCWTWMSSILFGVFEYAKVIISVMARRGESLLNDFEDV